MKNNEIGTIDYIINLPNQKKISSNIKKVIKSHFSGRKRTILLSDFMSHVIAENEVVNIAIILEKDESLEHLTSYLNLFHKYGGVSEVEREKLKLFIIEPHDTWIGVGPDYHANFLLTYVTGYLRLQQYIQTTNVTQENLILDTYHTVKYAPLKMAAVMEMEGLTTAISGLKLGLRAYQKMYDRNLIKIPFKMEN